MANNHRNIGQLFITIELQHNINLISEYEKKALKGLRIVRTSNEDVCNHKLLRNPRPEGKIATLDALSEVNNRDNSYIT